MRFTPEQLIDELYGPPKKEGQKRLEDFKKKKIPKPERPKGEFPVISAETPQGQEIIFDFEKIKEDSTELFQNLNLSELEKAIENLEINLSPEQSQRIQELAKEGFDKFYLLPPVELQNQNLAQTKQETEKELSGLAQKDQYSPEGTYLWESVRDDFPGKIQTLNRPKEKPYLLFIKDSPEVDDATRGKSAEELRQILKQKSQTGLTLPEYLVFQRDYVQKTKKHPETQYWTWLLDSELSPDSSVPGRVLRSLWLPGHRLVRVHSRSPSGRFSCSGARSSAIFEII